MKPTSSQESRRDWLEVVKLVMLDGVHVSESAFIEGLDPAENEVKLRSIVVLGK